MTDEELRVLCLDATLAGLQKKFVRTEDMEALLTAQGISLRERTPDKVQIPQLNSYKGKEKTIVLKAKIMRDTMKLRGEEKLPQSRGYSFVDFGQHAYALACLRELNNNKQYQKYAASGKDEEGRVSNHHSHVCGNLTCVQVNKLIVEFSVENMRKVSD